jgi:hypothetical protein
VWARVTASGLVALLLLLLVAGLARSAGDAESATGRGLPSPAGLFPVFVAVSAVVFVSVVAGMVLSGPRGLGRGPSPVRPLLLTIGLFLVAGIALTVLRPGERFTPDPGEEPAIDPAPPAGESVAGEDWLPAGPLALVLVLAMAGGAVIVARLAGDHGAEEPGPTPEDASVEGARRRLVAGLDDLIAGLRDEPDPRRAVILAWSRLEDLLALHRMPRRPAETPTTYVERVLRHLDTSAEAVEELVATFERAMFSVHPIARTDQLAAVDALLRVRADLEVRV